MLGEDVQVCTPESTPMEARGGCPGPAPSRCLIPLRLGLLLELELS